MIKKVYEMDPLICPRCGFPMRVLSCIEDPPVVRRILDHLGLWDACKRAPPAQPTATESIRGGVLSRVAEDPYPYEGSTPKTTWQCLQAGIAAQFVLDFPPLRGQKIVPAWYPKNQIPYPLR